jgi:serine/threonine protein kinase
MVDRVGQQLGNYQLIRPLGEGGFAEVYLGEHIHLGSQAAIKVLHSQLTSDDVDKFRMEARNLVRLVHPHIVRVLEFGIEGKTPFLVMDYAPNGTLRNRHPKGTVLPITTIVSYVKQIADALQFAHDEKLIHRDVKPENMLLGRRNEILLSDFGIAIVAQSSRYQNVQDMAGTIAYMAPEQIQAHPRPASDQYSLAIVVYEWLTGDRPFHGSFTEIAIKHSVVPPPPLREKVPTIPPDVEQVVMMALAKEPKERFGSVQAFANALEQASQGEMATFVKPPTPMLAPMVQPPRVVTPSQPPITPPLPPTQLAKPSTAPQLPPTLPVAVSKPTGPTIYTYRGHADAVTSVVWSPDSKNIASGGSDRTIQIWNAASGERTFIYQGHFGIVTGLAWSRDGKRIASGSSDHTVQVWNVVTGNTVTTYRSHTNNVHAVAWSPDQQNIASASADMTVQVWDASRGSYIIIYRGHSSSVRTLAWSPDGKYIASSGNDNEVWIWAATSARKVLTYRGHFNLVNTLAWSPDSKLIASGSDDQTAQVWNATTGSKVLTYHEHSGRVKALAWSPNGKYIASGSSDKTIEVWNATTGSKVFTYRDHSNIVNAVAWSPNGKYIASGGDDKTVQVWVAP